MSSNKSLPATGREPDFKGVLYIRERARRRLSSFIEGSAKKDVLNGADRTATRRRSLSNHLDGAPVVSKYYFELTGHVLSWFDLESLEVQQAPPQAKGMVSILSSNGIYRLTKDEVPVPYIGGFCISDAATDMLPRRGDVVVYSDNSLQLANWIGLLETAFKTYHFDPLADLGGPTQAANQKPILQSEMLSRDTFNGLPLDTWTKLHVSLFDNRLEFRSLHQQQPNDTTAVRRRSSLFRTVTSSLQVPTVRVDLLTINFYVGDSRVCPNAFLVSDFSVTHHFAARDHMEKLFWMQTIAKMLRQLVAIHEHALNAKQALHSFKSTVPHARRQEAETNSDDDDDDEDEAKQAEIQDAKRPPQVRRESMYRYYGLNMPPKEEEVVVNKPPPPPSGLNKPANQPPRMTKVQDAVAKSLSSMAPTKRKPAKQSVDALTVFYQDAAASWVDADFERLIKAAKQANAGTPAPAGAQPTIKVTFAQLAKHWGNDQADALGGILLRAKRNRVVKYEGDMLFKDYDDGVIVEVKI